MSTAARFACSSFASLGRIIIYLGVYFSVSALPLVSRHLRGLELYDTKLNDSILDFAGCPVLKEFEIFNFNFVHATRMLSKSLKHLSLLDCSASEQLRTHIHVPNLLSLQLEDPSDRTPVLGSMPLLVFAVVTYGQQTWSGDRCYNSESGDCNDSQCQGCYDVKGYNSDESYSNGTTKKESVLLRGLSKAESLVLVDECRSVYLHFTLSLLYITCAFVTPSAFSLIVVGHQ